MTVRLVTPSDFESIAAIHKASYSEDHLTSFFPLQLLQQYYKVIWDKNPVAFIAINEPGQPVGFVIGGDELDEPIQEFIKTHTWDLIQVLIKHPKFIFFRIIDKLKQAFEKKHTSIPFQLLSIAVKNDVQASGCGKLLLLAFEQQLRKNDIKQYGLSVKKTNKLAIQFYEKNNFNLELETLTLKCFYKNLI